MTGAGAGATAGTYTRSNRISNFLRLERDVFNFFKSKPAAGGPSRTAEVSGVTPERYYDALLIQLRNSTTLGQDSIALIKGAIGPLARLSGKGDKVDDAIQQVKLVVESSPKPAKSASGKAGGESARTITMKTMVNGQPMGQTTTFSFGPAGGSPASFTVTATVALQMGGGMAEKFLSAGLRNKINRELGPSINPVLIAAGESCGPGVKVVISEK